MTSGFISVFSSSLGLTVDTCLRQSTAAFVCGSFRIQRNAWFDIGYIQSGTLLSCGGEGFSPDDAYGSTLDSVMPMKGKHTINYLQYHEYGFGRPSLEREVQWDFRVHSSSCGAHRDVVHSPFEWLYHRCHCNCRDLVLFVGRLPWLCGPNVLRGVCVAMSCGGGCFSPDGAYDFAWDSVKPMKGSTPSITSSTLVDVGCVCMLNDWIAALTIFAPTTTTTSSSS